jgi:hypothetical protein
VRHARPGTLRPQTRLRVRTRISSPTSRVLLRADTGRPRPAARRGSACDASLAKCETRPIHKTSRAFVRARVFVAGDGVAACVRQGPSQGFAPRRNRGCFREGAALCRWRSRLLLLPTSERVRCPDSAVATPRILPMQKCDGTRQNSWFAAERASPVPTASLADRAIRRFASRVQYSLGRRRG